MKQEMIEEILDREDNRERSGRIAIIILSVFMALGAGSVIYTLYKIAEALL